MTQKRKTPVKSKRPAVKPGLRSRLFSRSTKFHIYLTVLALLIVGGVLSYKSLPVHGFPEPANPFVFKYTIPPSTGGVISILGSGDAPVPWEYRTLDGSNYPETFTGTFTYSLSYSTSSGTGQLELEVRDDKANVVATSSSGNPVVITVPAKDIGFSILTLPSTYKDTVEATLTVTWTPDPPPALPAPVKPAPAPAPAKDTTPPTVPAGLLAKATGATSIALTWNASSDSGSSVSGYRIYRGTSNNTMSLLTTVPGSLYIDSGLSASTAYYYYVTALDTAGNVSDPSVTVNATTLKQPPPQPAVTVTAPKDGDKVSGTVELSGTSGGGTPPIKSVQVEVDNNGFVTASGTTSWEYQLNTKLYADTGHTITVKAIDSADNSSTASVNLTFKSNSYSAEPPLAQGTWVSPEGMKVTVNSKGKNPHTGQLWTIADAYYMVKACAVGTGDFGKIAPYYTVNVIDDVGNAAPAQAYTWVSAGTGGDGNWSNFGATSYLDGVQGPMLVEPYDVACYEYGHAWTNYYYYLVRYPTSADNLHGSGITAPPDYLSERWVNAGGSITLAQNNNCRNSIDGWDGCMTDDRRILFGGPGTNGGSDAADQVPGEPNTGYKEPVIPYVNSSIISPQNQPGLADWYSNHWIAGR